MKAGFPTKRGRFSGRGFLSLSQEVMVRPRNLRDPNGFYFLFGVHPWASDKEIKSSYRKLSKRVHPDGSLPDEEMFILINQAYRVLIHHREEYNNLPEGVRWRLEGEKPISGNSVRLDPSKDEPDKFSYYYTHGRDDDLSESWYSAFQEELPRWGYQGRVAIKLGDRIDARGRRIEVPYLQPHPALVFVAAIQLINERNNGAT